MALATSMRPALSRGAALFALALDGVLPVSVSLVMVEMTVARGTLGAPSEVERDGSREGSELDEDGTLLEAESEVVDEPALGVEVEVYGWLEWDDLEVDVMVVLLLPLWLLPTVLHALLVLVELETVLGLVVLGTTVELRLTARMHRSVSCMKSALTSWLSRIGVIGSDKATGAEVSICRE